MIGVLKLGRLIASHREYLLLLALALVIGFLWVRGERAIADRDHVVATADQVCAAAGSAWLPAKAKASDRGKACRAAVADLAAYKSTTIAASVQLLTDASASRDAKSARDLAIARDTAASLAAAARKLEEENAKIGPDDRVGGDWFARLNDLVGLRPASR